MDNISVEYDGKIIQVVTYDIELPNGKVKRFEKARRAPGVRLIIKNDEGKILLNKEWRHELGGYDQRLPGGKVIDRLKDYIKFIDAGKDIEIEVLEAARREAREEVGIVLGDDTQILSKKPCGATMEWDLWYVVAKGVKFHENGTDFGSGEIIDGYERYQTDEILTMIGKGQIQEARTAGMLAQFILSK